MRRYLRKNRAHIKQLKAKEKRKSAANQASVWSLDDLERDPAISRVYAIMSSKQQTYVMEPVENER